MQGKKVPRSEAVYKNAVWRRWRLTIYLWPFFGLTFFCYHFLVSCLLLVSIYLLPFLGWHFLLPFFGLTFFVTIFWVDIFLRPFFCWHIFSCHFLYPINKITKRKWATMMLDHVTIIFKSFFYFYFFFKVIFGRWPLLGQLFQLL